MRAFPQRRVPSFPCPQCGGISSVKDSRPSNIGGASSVRRRRVCLECKARWTTWENTLGGGRLEQRMNTAARAVQVAIAALQNVTEEIRLLASDDGSNPERERE